MARHRAIHRKDITKDALVAEAKRYGARVLDLDGAIDALVWHRGHLLMVDWKRPGGKLTPTQERLIELGWPLHLVSTSQELRSLLFPGVSS